MLKAAPRIAPLAFLAENSFVLAAEFRKRLHLAKSLLPSSQSNGLPKFGTLSNQLVRNVIIQEVSDHKSRTPVVGKDHRFLFGPTKFPL